MSCPICSKDTDQKYRPFCSIRCADADLNRWMTGQYAVPSQDPDEADELLEALEKAAAEGAVPDPDKLH